MHFLQFSQEHSRELADHLAAKMLMELLPATYLFEDLVDDTGTFYLP